MRSCVLSPRQQAIWKYTKQSKVDLLRRRSFSLNSILEKSIAKRFDLPGDCKILQIFKCLIEHSYYYCYVVVRIVNISKIIRIKQIHFWNSLQLHSFDSLITTLHRLLHGSYFVSCATARHFDRNYGLLKNVKNSKPCKIITARLRNIGILFSALYFILLNWHNVDTTNLLQEYLIETCTAFSYII